MSNQDAIALRNKLEEMIVKEIQGKLARGEITGDRAKEIAEIVLEMVPENITEEELIKIIPKLDDRISELAGVVYKMLLEKDEKMKTEMLVKLREMIKEA